MDEYEDELEEGQIPEVLGLNSYFKKQREDSLKREQEALARIAKEKEEIELKRRQMEQEKLLQEQAEIQKVQETERRREEKKKELKIESPGFLELKPTPKPVLNPATSVEQENEESYSNNFEESTSVKPPISKKDFKQVNIKDSLGADSLAGSLDFSITQTQGDMNFLPIPKQNPKQKQQNLIKPDEG